MEDSQPNMPQPSIEDYATIEGYCDGSPIYSFGGAAYVYGVSPDLMPGAVMQENNSHPILRIKPKKSWEIKHNFCGSQHENEVRSPWNEGQAFLPIHLIDGDPDTVWCSWGCHVPDGRPEWIRIDLPSEKMVSSVSLVSNLNFGYGEYGKALPKEIEVKLSRDAHHWDTAYRSDDFSSDDSGIAAIDFEPRLAKQVWIGGNNFPSKERFPGHIFSIGAVEVLDPAGENVALMSRGASVVVSSVTSSHDNDWLTLDLLWAPLQYDLGNKWVRVGPDNGTFTWNFVEHEKGVLRIDPAADQSITEVVRNGINVILVVDFKGNWLYADPPKRTDWRRDRFLKVNNQYDDRPGAANDSPEQHQAYLRFVDYMVRHFKDRVVYFEIGNEWNNRMGVEEYMTDFFEPTYRAIKDAAPDARVALGNLAHWRPDKLLGCLAWEGPDGVWAPLIDAVGWHPTIEPDGAYFDAVRDLMTKCEALGFSGKYFASEIYAGSAYPPGPPDSASEIQETKFMARSLAGHAGLDMEAGPCHPHWTGFQHPQALCVPIVPGQPISQCRPKPLYYVWRTMATAMDDFYPKDLPVSFTGEQQLLHFTYESGDGTEIMLAAWMPTSIDAYKHTPHADGFQEAKVDLTLPGVQASEAWVIDIFNGTEQMLNLAQDGHDTLIASMLIKDYPTFVRMKLS